MKTENEESIGVVLYMICEKCYPKHGTELRISLAQ